MENRFLEWQASCEYACGWKCALVSVCTVQNVYSEACTNGRILMNSTTLYPSKQVCVILNKKQ